MQLTIANELGVGASTSVSWKDKYRFHEMLNIWPHCHRSWQQDGKQVDEEEYRNGILNRNSISVDVIKMRMFRRAVGFREHNRRVAEQEARSLSTLY